MDTTIAEQFAKIMRDKMTPELHAARREKEERKRQGREVYFIIDDNLVKIGFSYYPKSRLDQIKTSRPHARLLGSVAGGTKLEKEIHAKLSEYSYGGEWFYYTYESSIIINKYLSGEL